MDELKKEALQNYLDMYRCLTRIDLIFDSIGLSIEKSFNDPESEDTVEFQLKTLFNLMTAYIYKILGIKPRDEITDVFLDLSNRYSYGDDSISADTILSEVLK